MEEPSRPEVTEISDPDSAAFLIRCCETGDVAKVGMTKPSHAYFVRTV
jgi:hypothetical protein